jgi:hypothetical protein
VVGHVDEHRMGVSKKLSLLGFSVDYRTYQAETLMPTCNPRPDTIGHARAMDSFHIFVGRHGSSSGGAWPAMRIGQGADLLTLQSSGWWVILPPADETRTCRGSREIPTY